MPKEKLIPWKSYLGKLWDGRKIYVVDGTYIRDHYFADFVEGSNCCAYPEFVPKGEIWLERDQEPVDLVESLIHEILECTLMCYGLKKTYNAAHDATNTVSTLLRKARHVNDRDQDIKKLSLLSTYPESQSPKAPPGIQKVPMSKLVS